MQKGLTVTLTQGLSGSGKSTWAVQQVEASKGNTVNICKDDIRKMLWNSAYSKGREDMVKKVRDNLILLALSENKNVIVSDTNFDNHIPHIKELVSKYAMETKRQIDVIVEDFTNVPLDVCIERDAKRPNSLGRQVILSQYNRWLRKDVELPVDPNKPRCAVFDVDGTLTKGPKDRSPYDWGKVGNDEPNASTILLAKALWDQGLSIVVSSGRDSVCRAETEQWLKDHDINYDVLIMRQEGDNRGDDIVKEEFLLQQILPKYNVTVWVDDRLRVCRMLHKHGVPLFRVGDPDAEF